MIVKIAGWLYIIDAALGLSTLTVSLPVFAASSQLGTLIMSGAIGAIGVGLLQHKIWARWLALGTSFLGWTLGSLFLVGFVGLALFAFGAIKAIVGGAAAGGIAAFVMFVLIVLIAMTLIGVIISFKLYQHLMSEEGKAEFGAPDSDSFATVLKSAGAWIGIWIVSAVFVSGGSPMSSALARLALSRGGDSRSTREIERDAEHRRAELEAARFEREREDNRRRAAAEAARLEAERNAAYETKPAVDAGAQASEVAQEHETARESVRLESEKTEKPASNRIVKCRDEAGSMSYTQGYCPPGTKEVEAAKFE